MPVEKTKICHQQKVLFKKIYKIIQCNPKHGSVPKLHAPNNLICFHKGIIYTFLIQ
jgi:hypothetical protein